MRVREQLRPASVREWVVRRFGHARFRRWFGVHLLLAVALFGVGVVLGVVVVQFVTAEQLAAFAGDLEGSALPERLTVWTILSNNLLALAVDAAGLLTLGLTSVFSLLLNGFTLGFVFGLASGDASPVVLLAFVVPHGVFELPAFWMVAALAFRVTHRTGNYLLGRDERGLTRQELFEVGVVLAAAVVLLAVAAVVEVHVTPAVGEFAGG